MFLPPCAFVPKRNKHIVLVTSSLGQCISELSIHGFRDSQFFYKNHIYSRRNYFILHLLIHCKLYVAAVISLQFIGKKWRFVSNFQSMKGLPFLKILLLYHLVWLNTTLDALKTRPLIQILLFLRNNTLAIWKLQTDYHLVYIFATVWDTSISISNFAVFLHIVLDPLKQSRLPFSNPKESFVQFRLL